MRPSLELHILYKKQMTSIPTSSICPPLIHSLHTFVKNGERNLLTEIGSFKLNLNTSSILYKISTLVTLYTKTNDLEAEFSVEEN